VSAIQHGNAIFHLSASFQPDEPGPEHQTAMPDAPDPETVPNFEERIAKIPTDKLPEDVRAWIRRERPIEVRTVGAGSPFDHTKRPPAQLAWIRARGTLPDSPLLHECIVAYASDMTLLDTITLPHGIVWSDGSYAMASLDHAMWFHRPFRADEWLLYAQESPIAHGARGFATGRLFRRDGTLVVSVAQEGLIRPLGQRC
jgi:acyl-CoA thioesterase-2